MNEKTTLSQIIKDTLKAEADTLAHLAVQPTESLVALVDRISQSSGRLVITGVGKSALAAQKITATLNSTGTPSIYMHAADAVHGDVGMVQTDDVVIVVSKSGSSDELLQLVPLINARGAYSVAWTSSDSSPLLKVCNHHIIIPVSEEADPNGLAPTSSTIAHIAMGDALALALQHVNGWDAQSFAALHPAGALGRRLHLMISEVIDDQRLPQVSPHTAIKDVIMEISSNRLGAAAVVDLDLVVGIITDGDLRRMLQSHEIISQLRAADIMTAAPKSVLSTSLAYDALRLLEDHNINQIIVADEGVYKGMVHLHDLLAVGF